VLPEGGLVSSYAAERTIDQNQYILGGGGDILMSGIAGVKWDELVHMKPEARYFSFKYGNYSGTE
jgi:hypothetical protein